MLRVLVRLAGQLARNLEGDSPRRFYYPDGLLLQR